jgi:hypothetical protein
MVISVYTILEAAKEAAQLHLTRSAKILGFAYE